jgi:hypothetical protein
MFEIINEASPHFWRKSSVRLKFNGIDRNCYRLVIGR